MPRWIPRLVLPFAVALVVTGGAMSSWRSLGLDIGSLSVGLYGFELCFDCDEACSIRNKQCLDNATALYGACDRNACHVEGGKTVCTSSACKEEGHCATLAHRCKAGCKDQPRCQSGSLFEAGGKALALGKRDRHLMSLAGMAGMGTLLAGGLACILLLILALVPRRGLAIAASIASGVALAAGATFAITSGMRAPIGGTSLGLGAYAWIAGAALALAAAIFIAVVSAKPR